MKRLKKFVALLATVAICALVPGANVLTVSAAEPVTYHVKYIEEDGEWRFQVGDWDEEGNHRELYYLYQDFKDGDILVVDSNDYTKAEAITMSKHVSNLTVIDGSHAVVSAPSFGEVYALLDSSVAVTGNVGTGYIYDNSAVTFHSNINKLILIDTQGQATGHATVGGTAGHVIRQTDTGYIYYQVYNVAAGKLNIEWSELKTDSAYYSTTPTAAPAPVQTPAQTPAASTQQPASSGDYDDVPKTGESNTVLLLTGIAVLCLLGKRALKEV